MDHINNQSNQINHSIIQSIIETTLKAIITILNSNQPQIESKGFIPINQQSTTIDHKLVHSLANLLDFTKTIIKKDLNQNLVISTNQFTSSSSKLLQISSDQTWTELHQLCQTVIKITNQKLLSILPTSSARIQTTNKHHNTTIDSKLQIDLENVLSTINQLYSNSNELFKPRTNNQESNDDEVVSAIERMSVRRLNSQRATLPKLVSEGVTPMGWNIKKSKAEEEEDLKQFELFNRIERASSRRLSDQCFINTSSSLPLPISPVQFYMESMRETNSIENILNRSSIGEINSQDALQSDIPILQKKCSISTILTNMESECTERTSLLPHLLDSTTQNNRSQSMPNIFGFKRKSSKTLLINSPNPSIDKSYLVKGLFGNNNKKITTTNETNLNSFSLLDSLPPTPKPQQQFDQPLVQQPVTLKIKWLIEVTNRIGKTNLWLWKPHVDDPSNDNNNNNSNSNDIDHHEVIITILNPKLILIEPEKIEINLPIPIKSIKKENKLTYILTNEYKEENKKEEIINEFYGIKEWKTNKPKKINCKKCSNQIIKLSEKEKINYKSLPSDGWEEFIGHWICHEPEDHQGYFGGKDKSSSWRRWPGLNEIFIADQFIELLVFDGKERGWKEREFDLVRVFFLSSIGSLSLYLYFSFSISILHVFIRHRTFKESQPPSIKPNMLLCLNSFNRETLYVFSKDL
ncbi:hypothetical protein CROQUDRAFT_252385 [Cronartium quercuum f. sp. fusiforme G11]|uniref:Uncharacterized protein n=1 Tax=Cronartium quercuum f. sp. fusiforme G11 TaxID=708437 RepID=A0A9P6ND80_9BASI|nr:hypothetical protein CROQUDRAFT_252385 [Cronartium quercuum f. sp. fusiforme G11]